MRNITQQEVENLQKALGDIFEQLGFSCCQINHEENYTYKGCYYHLTYIGGLKSFVIEYAESLEDAQKGIYWDGDFISLSRELKSMKKRLKALLERYYKD